MSDDAPQPESPFDDERRQREAVREGYDALADAYDDARDPPAGERDLLAALRERLAGVDGPATLIDAGCGAGRGPLRTFADDPAVAPLGVDFSHEQVRRARDHASAVAGDVTALPVADGVADAVTALYSLIHVPVSEHPDCYAEFARVLGDDGWLLLTAGTAAWGGTNDDWLGSGTAMHWSIPGPERTRRFLADAGFTVVGRATVDSDAGGTWDCLLCRLDGAPSACDPPAGNP